MQEVNILNLIKNSNPEIVVAAALSCVLTLTISASHKFSSKTFFVISFVIGTCGCFILSLCLNAFSVSVIMIKNAVASGTLSVTITAFIKRFAFLESDDIKTSLQKLLSSIILSDKLDEVVDEIILKLGDAETTLTGQELKVILKENTTLNDDEKLDAVVNIIIEALNKHTKT